MRRRFLSNINKSISGGNDYHSEYFTIEALENGLTVKLSQNASEYRIDDGGWNNLSAGSNTPSINKGQTLSFKGNLTANSSSGIGTFTISKKCNLKGNIMSMLYGVDFIGQNDLSGKSYAFYRLFYNCKNIVDASKLILPATTLYSCCYQSMFEGCTSLTTAPELPATTLNSYCYQSMFQGCTSLTTAPQLPATTLANYCYNSMFEGCTSLTTAPELPATTLNSYCYQSMFQGCTSLTTAPKLPATTLADFCCEFMFEGCTSLTTAPELPATILADYCYDNMFGNCYSLTTAPELPATALTFDCYNNMFYNCTSLTTAPELPATILADYCYDNMFGNCYSLTTAPELPATTLAESCYQNMFYNCTSLTTAPEQLPATTLADSCYYSMFQGCTSLTTAPELPATTLDSYCYYYMFSSCTSLTTAPELPATKLTAGCYNSMFKNCRNLSYIKMLATDISAYSCLEYWVYGVAETGTFVKHPNMVTLPIGVDGIPNGWTVEDYYTITSYKELTIEARDVAWNKTNTTITWSVLCDAITNQNEVIEVTETGKTVSDTFEQNTSNSNVIREITFTYMGLTATTTIIQSAYYEIPVGYDEYLTFTNTGEDTLLISLLEINNESIYPHSFSIDNGEWVEANEDTYALITPEQTVRFKSNFNSFTNNGDEEPVIKLFLTLSLEENNPSCSVSGNIMSLIHGDDFVGVEDLNGYDCAFACLFASEGVVSIPSCITDASNLILPATTLADNCYGNMFSGCTSLTTAPELPATTLADNCYGNMFSGCTSLTTAPQLPATTLANYCYNSMFEGCTSLTTAPELPATTLNSYCYQNMFYNCTSLTTAPQLPATTLADNCYGNMFSGCSNLNYIKMLATDISAYDCLAVWVNGVASTGTFVKNPDMTLLPTGSSGIPSGWTVDNAEMGISGGAGN